MISEAPGIPRAIPPQPAIAWFLRDLVSDKLWDEFDIGRVRHGRIADVQRRLMSHGGERAWLQFVEQTRAALPQLLSVSIFEAFRPRLNGWTVVPREITLHCAPVLSAFVGGRPVQPAITLDCSARFAFCQPNRPASGEYALAQTELSLSHEKGWLLDRVSGYFFVPMPLP